MIKNNTKTGFTLIEILIVVSILGILAAVIIPEFMGHTTKAKESAAKEMLQMLRTRIELYTIEHNEMSPGYLNGNMSGKPDGIFIITQLMFSTNMAGQWAPVGTAGYDYGPYINDIPKNPFNEGDIIFVLTNDPKVTEPSPVSDVYGWIYYGPTRMIRLNTFGLDSTGMDYQDY